MSRLSPISRRRASPARRLAGSSLPASLAASPAAAEPIAVIVDRAKVMRISRPADIVIIGNPAIADATIQDNQTLIITGRSFGTTNLIVLDADGQAIADEIITVGAAERPGRDRLPARLARDLLAARRTARRCWRSATTPTSFDTVNAQIQSHGSLSDAAADQVGGQTLVSESLPRTARFFADRQQPFLNP